MKTIIVGLVLSVLKIISILKSYIDQRESFQEY